MPDNQLNFDRAEYTPEPPSPEFYAANAGDGGALSRAILFGLGAAILGCLLYAGFTIVTHIEIGYVALGVGYLVGKAMIAGSKGRGGRSFQIAAAVLTYLAVSMAAVPELLWSLHKEGSAVGQISSRGWLVLTKYGVASPFLGLTHGIGGILGLFILFIGIRAAWRLTSASASTAASPFTGR